MYGRPLPGCPSCAEEPERKNLEFHKLLPVLFISTQSVGLLSLSPCWHIVCTASHPDSPLLPWPGRPPAGYPSDPTTSDSKSKDTHRERGQNKASSCKTWYVWLSWLCMDISFWQLIHWSAEYRNISAEVSTICKWSCSQQQVSKKTVNSYRSSVQTHKLPVQTLELLVGWYFTSQPVSSTSNLCAKHIKLQKKSESGINLPADVLTAVRHCEKYMTILKVSNIGPSPFPIWSMSS